MSNILKTGRTGFDTESQIQAQDNESNSNAYRPTQAVTGRSSRKIPRVGHDAIARRAYEIYVRKGCQSGNCNENWQEAEDELC